MRAASRSDARLLDEGNFGMCRTVDGETVHCIAISGECRPSVHIFYAKGVAERRIWAQKILEATTPVFPTRYTADLTRAGWAYLKVCKTAMQFVYK